MNKNVAVEYGLESGRAVSRSYMFTVWFSDSITFAGVRSSMLNLFDGLYLKYGCLSSEICPDSGRLHGHLFLRLSAPMSGVKLVKLFGFPPGGAWFEEARKDFPSYEYVSCSGHFAEGQRQGKPKPLDFFEIGERPRSESVSKKKDFSACLLMMEEGADLMDVCRAFPEIALKGFSNLQRLYLLIRENKSKQKLSAQYDANKVKEELEAKEQEMLHGLKGKEYFLNPHFEPEKVSLAGVVGMFQQ